MLPYTALPVYRQFTYRNVDSTLFSQCLLNAEELFSDWNIAQNPLVLMVYL